MEGNLGRKEEEHTRKTAFAGGAEGMGLWLEVGVFHGHQDARWKTSLHVREGIMANERLEMQRLHPDPQPRLPASLRWPIRRQAFPQGQLPHH